MRVKDGDARVLQHGLLQVAWWVAQHSHTVDVRGQLPAMESQSLPQLFTAQQTRADTQVITQNTSECVITQSSVNCDTWL